MTEDYGKFIIYTDDAECRDCYKCVRECPVKAIEIKNNKASVIEDLCIGCGKCISVCPADAKRIINDKNYVQYLIKNYKVILSIAPSWEGFFNCSEEKFIAQSRNTGFYGVSETAIGAEITAFRQIESDSKNVISSACPAVCALISKYYPELEECVSNLLTPAMEHAVFLKKYFGKDYKVVLAAPCPAKKFESKRTNIYSNSEIDAVLTFTELNEMFDDVAKEDEIPNKNFIPYESGVSSIFPIEGGFAETIKSYDVTIPISSFSGIENIISICEEIKNNRDNDFGFLELLSCSGGCVNSSLIKKKNTLLNSALKVKKNAHKKNNRKAVNKSYFGEKIVLESNYPGIQKTEYSDEEVRIVLEKVGKYGLADHINCGGCGYESCKSFACAMLDGKAEEQMCVTYMRKIAQKKVNALIRTLPLGVVILDSKYDVVDCNNRFMEKFFNKKLDSYQISKAVNNAMNIKSIQELENLFSDVFMNPLLIIEKNINYKNRVFRSYAFTIEENKLYGGIFKDVTSEIQNRETIVKKTQEVISKSLESVQSIASLLGENAAETEIILDSIIKVFEIPEEENEKLY